MTVIFIDDDVLISFKDDHQEENRQSVPVHRHHLQKGKSDQHRPERGTS
jgi:hypothetical protein